MSQRFYIPFTQLFTNLGAIGPGWKMKTYQTNTNTPLATYSDVGLSTPNANPANPAVTTGNQVADENGRLGDMFVADRSLYKLVMTDENDVVIETTDPVDGLGSSIIFIDPLPAAFWGTTAGGPTAFTLNPSLVPITSYSYKQCFFIDFNVACNASPTININNIGVVNLKKYDGQGTKVALNAGDVQPQRYIAINDGIDIVILNPEIVQNLKANNLTVNTSLNGALLTNKRITISNNVSDANNDIDFSAGIAHDITNNVVFALTAITKRLDAAWAVGTNQGGLDTGTRQVSTWYYCYAIFNPTTSVADAIFSASAVSPTLPSGYTVYGYVGAIRSDAGNANKSFVQKQNYFFLNALVEDRALAAAPTSPTNLTLTAPPSTIAITDLYALDTGGGATPSVMLMCPTTFSTKDASTTNFTLRVGAPGGSQQVVNSEVQTIVNSSSQVSTDSDQASFNFQVLTKGWIDTNLF